MSEAPRTPRGQDYKKHFPEKREDQLFIPRNLEGEPNWEIFDTADALEGLLSKYPWFIGLTIYGSKMLGYSNKDSDLDIGVFYDSKEIKLGNLLQDIGMSKNNLPAISKINVDIKTYDLARNRMADLIKGQDGLGYLTFSLFCGPVKGPRVKEYRDALKVEVENLSEQKRKQFIEDLGDMLGSMDRQNHSERKERGLDTTENDIEVSPARQELWKKRALKALGISE